MTRGLFGVKFPDGIFTAGKRRQCQEGIIRITMQDYKSPRVEVVIRATLVNTQTLNTQTDTQTDR